MIHELNELQDKAADIGLVPALAKVLPHTIPAFTGNRNPIHQMDWANQESTIRVEDPHQNIQLPEIQNAQVL